MADDSASFGGLPDSTTFSHGEFVFDPDHPWDEIRGGVISDREGELWLWYPGRTPEELKGDPYQVRVSEYPGRLKANVLLGAIDKRRPKVDVAPYYAIKSVVLYLLRDADAQRLPLDELIRRLREKQDLAHDRIEETLRMMVTEGSTNVTINKAQVILYSLSELMTGAYARIDYLATFADELLIKSRRVDLLIQHTGTVGSYREEMLRALLRQIVPRRYEVSTGFIEHCPRQLDILIWDASEFVPLFREGDVVVVPRTAVRAVIEVKTTLNTKALDEAMHILWDAFRVNPTAVPVFKGIFAYEPGYASDAALADRMRTFYRGIEPDGIIEHEHWYMFSGINMVCVPRKLLLREVYKVPDDLSVHPQPHLSGVISDWPGDTKTALFLGGLLSHLDMASVPKSDAVRLFDPLLSTMETNELGAIYETPWSPCTAANGMEATFDPDGARTYLQRVQDFRQGKITAVDIGIGLSRPMTRPGIMPAEPGEQEGDQKLPKDEGKVAQVKQP